MDDDDRELEALLSAHAERMTEDLTDSSVAYAAVARRARVRRGRRTAVAGALAAAAAVAGVLVVASATGDQANVLTPATSPTPSSAAPTTAVAPTIAPSTLTPTTVPTTAPAVPATTIPVQPVPPPTAPPTTAPSASTETYDGTGGSITVRLSVGTVALVGDPSPAPGYTTRVDDNGPDRVRVRFERDDVWTEIRVEVAGGELVPEIIED